MISLFNKKGFNFVFMLFFKDSFCSVLKPNHFCTCLILVQSFFKPYYFQISKKTNSKKTLKNKRKKKNKKKGSQPIAPHDHQDEWETYLSNTPEGWDQYWEKYSTQLVWNGWCEKFTEMYAQYAKKKFGNITRKFVTHFCFSLTGGGVIPETVLNLYTS